MSTLNPQSPQPPKPPNNPQLPPDLTASLPPSLLSKAAALTDPKQRAQLLRSAYASELSAKSGQPSRKARMLSSGAFQGAASGAGIGGAVGVGLGTVAGTLVGAVASVPGVIVGGLVGAGTGIVHGPWILLGSGKGAGEDGQAGGGGGGEKVPIEAVEDGSVLVDEGTGRVKAVVDRAGLDRATARAEMVERTEGGGVIANGEEEKKKERKKPRKLEVRGKKKGEA